jgi:hypothetical protein
MKTKPIYKICKITSDEKSVREGMGNVPEIRTMSYPILTTFAPLALFAKSNQSISKTNALDNLHQFLTASKTP